MRREWPGVGLVLVLGCAPMAESESESAPTPAPAPAVVVEPDPAAASSVAAPAPAPDTQASEPAAELEPATRGDGSCVVTIVALLDAEEYRGGGPMTPALEASLARDPDYARMYNAESHGDHHIQCHYEVALAHMPGKRFRWREVHSNTLRDLTTEVCKQDLAKVADSVISSTKQCSDFAAGAYWGYVLEPFL